MNRQTVTNFFLIFFFLIVASTGNKAVSVVPVAAIKAIKTETVSHQKEKRPHTELEGTHFQLTAAAHALTQKTVIPFYLLPAPAFCDRRNSVDNFRLKTWSLLVKDYLFHIYPSHNFW